MMKEEKKTLPKNLRMTSLTVFLKSTEKARHLSLFPTTCQQVLPDMALLSLTVTAVHLKNRKLLLKYSPKYCSDAVYNCGIEQPVSCFFLWLCLLS
eukprot:m.160707 g.160707  ORF g.160707 m.160707 type:complete len:96 (+) comp38779_c0_seq1:593-880(+)